MVNQHAADGIRYNVNLLYRTLTDTRPYEIVYRIANLQTHEVYQIGDHSNAVVPADMIRSTQNRRDRFRNTFVDPNNWHAVPVPDELQWVNRGVGSDWGSG